MKKIGFLIINYNDYKTTNKLIDNIKDYKCLDEIVVVDNNSTDDSQKELEKNKEITLIKNDENLGFAKALNIGCRYLIQKYKDCSIFISNSDIRIKKEEDLKTLLTAFESEKVAVVGPVIKEPNAILKGFRLTSVFEDLMLDVPLLNKFYKNKLISYKKSHYKDVISEVDMVKGCFFAIDSKALEYINYFDENTFLYYEENILAKKLKTKNYKTVLHNDVTIFHDHEVTISKNVNKKRQYNITKESMMYYEKNYNHASKFSLLLFKILNSLNSMTLKIRNK